MIRINSDHVEEKRRSCYEFGKRQSLPKNSSIEPKLTPKHGDGELSRKLAKAHEEFSNRKKI